MTVPDISLVVPLYNEEENLPELAREIRAAMTGTGRTWELLFVDDGSTDGSLAVLRALAAGEPEIRVLRHRRNAGQSAGLDTGFRAARGRVVVTLDADLQNDPADVPRLLAELERGFDVVSGVRVERHDKWTRRISSRIANGVRNWATDERITDVGCSLKAYRREYLEHLPMFTGMHRFLPTLVRWNGARVAELPVRHRPRRHGVAKYGIGNRLFRALADLFAVRWMRRRWIDPRNCEEVETRTGPGRGDG
ncbi:MAG: glycosyltransferase family 2 protein [Thermoanaerobaculia bacterium]|nr:MAG: glycosyltransferase family 2 protein [Thermoanaerobaculia bacterium]